MHVPDSKKKETFEKILIQETNVKLLLAIGFETVQTRPKRP